MYLAGHEDYKEICEDARLEDRAHYELMTPRLYELGGSLPYNIYEFADRAGCAHAFLPGTDNGQHPPEEGGPSAEDILLVLLESERCAIRSWAEICDMTRDKDERTYDPASRILDEEIEHEAWFIELLFMERDGVVRPSGHFRRGEPGEAPPSTPRIARSTLRKTGRECLAKEESFTVRVEFPDNSESTFEAGAEDILLGAAHSAGLELPSLCEQGWDLACAVKVLEGEVDQSDSLRYFEEDEECAFALPCTGKAHSDLRIVAYQTGEMHKCRDEHGLPAPRGT